MMVQIAGITGIINPLEWVYKGDAKQSDGSLPTVGGAPKLEAYHRDRVDHFIGELGHMPLKLAALSRVTRVVVPSAKTMAVPIRVTASPIAVRMGFRCLVPDLRRQSVIVACHHGHKLSDGVAAGCATKVYRPRCSMVSTPPP